MLKVTRRTREVDIILNQQIAEDIARLGDALAEEATREQVTEAGTNRQAKATAKRIEQLREQADAETLKLTLRALPVSKWAQALAAHRNKNGTNDMFGTAASALPLMLDSATIGGKPVACTHSLDKDVPANAVFTDHTYANMTAATDSAAGKAGLVPAPAAGAQGKFLRGDGTWQAIASSGLSAYPVGSIFQTVSTTSPAELFGGTWQEIAFNRVLMGAGTGYTAGSTVEAGLPNITGSFTTKSTDVGGSPFSGDANVLSAKGSLTFSEKSTSYGGYTGHSGSQYNIQFDASRSNPIYGRSYTVQPAAYYVHIWKRVA